MNETELISVENGWSYLKPITLVPWYQRVAEGIAFILLITGLTYGLFWLISIGAF